MSAAVLVDSSVWSLAYRHRQPGSYPQIVDELQRLVAEDNAFLIGPVRQEILSGVRHSEQFDRLDRLLMLFPEPRIISEDYRRAARCFNACRARGVQGSPTDFLLCAIALRLDLAVFTTDGDFALYEPILAVRRHRPGAQGRPA